MAHLLQHDDPAEVHQLLLDNNKIPAIRDLLSPTSDEEHSLAEYVNLIHLSLNNCTLADISEFPVLEQLQKLELGDNRLSGEQLNSLAALPNLLSLDLSNNAIADVEQLEPLIRLPSLRHLVLLETGVAKRPDYRTTVFDLLPNLLTLDDMDKDGNEVEILSEDDEEEDEELDEYDEGRDAEGEEDDGSEDEQEVTVNDDDEDEQDVESGDEEQNVEESDEEGEGAEDNDDDDEEDVEAQTEDPDEDDQDDGDDDEEVEEEEEEEAVSAQALPSQLPSQSGLLSNEDLEGNGFGDFGNDADLGFDSDLAHLLSDHPLEDEPGDGDFYPEANAEDARDHLFDDDAFEEDDSFMGGEKRKRENEDFGEFVAEGWEGMLDQGLGDVDSDNSTNKRARTS
ncbi:hypothetical protein BC832DRAFT_596360 [Gaertneriomyces semiglobifer]|nr:hypothetical protein BC832DRAFT_596360 [Gaertneriomyces semiglobifer]